MCKNAIFLGKDSLILIDSLDVIHVGIGGSYSFEVVDFTDALLANEALGKSLRVAHRRRVLVWQVRYDVVTHAVQVVGSRDLGCFWRPRIRSLRILLVLGALDHLVEEVLEGLSVGGWLRTNVISGAARELLCGIAHAVTIKSALICEAQSVGVFGGAVGNLTFGNLCEIFTHRDRSSSPVHRECWVSPNKVLKVFHWVDPCVALLSLHEAPVGTHWLWLRCLSSV